MKQQEILEQIARSKFQLYMRYGIGDFPNYLDNKISRITREDVIQALTFDSVRDLAADHLYHLLNKADELKRLLHDS